MSLPSIFYILKKLFFLVIHVYNRSGTTHRFVAGVLQHLIVINIPKAVNNMYSTMLFKKLYKELFHENSLCKVLRSTSEILWCFLIARTTTTILLPLLLLLIMMMMMMMLMIMMMIFIQGTNISKVFSRDSYYKKFKKRIFKFV